MAGTTRSRKPWSMGIRDCTNAFANGRCSRSVVVSLPAGSLAKAEMGVLIF
jgi:hypothetical protein